MDFVLGQGFWLFLPWPGSPGSILLLPVVLPRRGSSLPGCGTWCLIGILPLLTLCFPAPLRTAVVFLGLALVPLAWIGDAMLAGVSFRLHMLVEDLVCLGFPSAFLAERAMFLWPSAVAQWVSCPSAVRYSLAQVPAFSVAPAE